MEDGDGSSQIKQETENSENLNMIKKRQVEGNGRNPTYNYQKMSPPNKK